MKTISRYIIAVVALVIGPAILLPATNSMAVVAKSPACTTLPTLQTNFESTLTTHLARMNTDFTARISNVDNRVNTVDPKIDASRVKAATAFDASIATLSSQPSLTDVQKSAVDTFHTQMKAAEKTREDAVDSARIAYRADLVIAVQQHQTALTTAAAAFQTTVATAFTTAIGNCSDATAKTTLKTAIATARTTLTEARKSVKVTDQVKQLMLTRNTAIKTANETFAKSAATYSADLSTILGVTVGPTASTSVNNSPSASPTTNHS